MLRHISGVVLALAGVAFIWLGLQRRRQVLAQPATPLHPSLVQLSAVAPPLVLFGLMAAAAEVVLAFFLTDGGGVFSVIDLAGFLLLLLGYGVWFVLKTQRR